MIHSFICNLYLYYIPYKKIMQLNFIKYIIANSISKYDKNI